MVHVWAKARIVFEFIRQGCHPEFIEGNPLPNNVLD